MNKQPQTPKVVPVKDIPLTQKALSGAYNKTVNSNKSGIGFGGEAPTRTLPSQQRGTSIGYMSQPKKK